MYMPSLDQILSRVVERKGYAVQGADSEGILARRGEERLLMAWKTDGPLAVSDVVVFVTALEQVQATRGILVAARGTEPAAREHASQDKRLEVWAESRLVVEVGEALVKDALDTRDGNGAPAPVAEPITAALPVASPMGTTGVAQTTPVSGAASTASRPPPARFPSLIATAVGLTNGDNRGAAYYMPSKPKTPAPTPASAQPLRYAWSGISGRDVDPGVAQVRNGRRPTAAATAAAERMVLPEHRDVEIVSTPRRARAEPAPETAVAPAPILPNPIKPSALVASDDVELISTPRRRAAPEPEPAEPAPATSAVAPTATPASVPAPLGLEPAPVAQSPSAAPAAVSVTSPAPAPATSMRMRAEVVETEDYDIVSTPRRRGPDDA